MSVSVETGQFRRRVFTLHRRNRSVFDWRRHGNVLTEPCSIHWCGKPRGHDQGSPETVQAVVVQLHLSRGICDDVGDCDMEKHRRVRAALAGHPDQVFDFVDFVANRVAFVGSRVKWSRTTISAPQRTWFGSLRRSACTRPATRTRPGLSSTRPLLTTWVSGSTSGIFAHDTILRNEDSETRRTSISTSLPLERFASSTNRIDVASVQANSRISTHPLHTWFRGGVP